MMTKTFEDNIVEPDEKTVLPAGIANDMNNWRAGWACMPREYIKFHASVALQEWRRIRAKYSVKQLVDPRLVPDGWMDGMRVIEVLCERSDGEPLTLRWSDGSQKFLLYKLNAGGGSLWESEISPAIEEAKLKHAFPWGDLDGIKF